MSTQIAKLSPSLRGNAQVQSLVNQLSTARKRASEARSEAKMSLTPGMSALASACGAGASGALAVYAPRQNVMLSGLGALASILAGAFSDRPELVNFGNGLAAPLIADKVREMLSASRASKRAATNEEQAA